MRGVEVHLGLRRAAEAAVAPAQLDVALGQRSSPVASTRYRPVQPTRGWPPGWAATSNPRSEKRWRQSHGVSMRSRIEPAGLDAEHEVRRRADAQQPPQHGLAVRRGDPGRPAGRGGLRDGLAQPAVGLHRVGGPRPQLGGQPAPALLVEVGGPGRPGARGRIGQRGKAAGVERLMLVRRDRVVPVAPLLERGVGEQPVDQALRAGVVQHLGQVLAAHQVDVVDPQVGGHDLVTRRTAGPGPLDDPRRSAVEGVGGGEEGPPVGEAVLEVGPQLAVVPQLLEPVPPVGREVGEASTGEPRGWPRRRRRRASRDRWPAR